MHLSARAFPPNTCYQLNWMCTSCSLIMCGVSGRCLIHGLSFLSVFMEMDLVKLSGMSWKIWDKPNARWRPCTIQASKIVIQVYLLYTFNMNAELGDDGNLLRQNCQKLNSLHTETTLFDISHFVHLSFPAELLIRAWFCRMELL